MVCETVRSAIAVASLLAAATVPARADDAGILFPPPYDFSDEMGGSSVAVLGGIGTRADPVRIAQVVRTASPVTLVVRATRPINPFGRAEEFATGTIHMILDVTNETGIPWIGLELELQERFEQPSIYGDGLSFDQRRIADQGATSNAFANVRYDFEPYDRLLFEEGALDPRHRAEFRFLITDLTPIRTFYVRLDPRIPAS